MKSLFDGISKNCCCEQRLFPRDKSEKQLQLDLQKRNFHILGINEIRMKYCSRKQINQSGIVRGDGRRGESVRLDDGTQDCMMETRRQSLLSLHCRTVLKLNESHNARFSIDREAKLQVQKEQKQNIESYDHHQGNNQRLSFTKHKKKITMTCSKGEMSSLAKGEKGSKIVSDGYLKIDRAKNDIIHNKASQQQQHQGPTTSTDLLQSLRILPNQPQPQSRQKPTLTKHPSTPATSFSPSPFISFSSQQKTKLDNSITTTHDQVENSMLMNGQGSKDERDYGDKSKGGRGGGNRSSENDMNLGNRRVGSEGSSKVNCQGLDKIGQLRRRHQQQQRQHYTSNHTAQYISKPALILSPQPHPKPSHRPQQSSTPSHPLTNTPQPQSPLQQTNPHPTHLHHHLTSLQLQQTHLLTLIQSQEVEFHQEYQQLIKRKQQCQEELRKREREILEVRMLVGRWVEGNEQEEMEGV